MWIHELGLPLAVIENVCAEGYNESTVRWMEDVGICTDEESRGRCRATGCGALAAVAYSYAAKDLVQLASDLIGWLFLFDDHYPDGFYRNSPEALRLRLFHYLDLWDGKGREMQARSAFGVGLLDLKRRLVRFAPEWWLPRFRAALAAYFEGCLGEVNVRVEGRWPTKNEYMTFRHGSIGAYPVFDLVQLAGRAIPSEAEHASREFQEFRRAAADLLGFANDLVSWKKESDEDASFNILAVLQRENRLSRAEALAEFAALHRSMVTTLLEKEDGLRAREGKGSPLVFCAEGIKLWLEANFQWQFNVARYKEHSDLGTLRSVFEIPGSFPAVFA